MIKCFPTYKLKPILRLLLSLFLVHMTIGAAAFQQIGLKEYDKTESSLLKTWLHIDTASSKIINQIINESSQKVFHSSNPTHDPANYYSAISHSILSDEILADHSPPIRGKVLFVEKVQSLNNWRSQISFLWLGIILLSLLISILMHFHTKQKIFAAYFLFCLGSSIVISLNIDLVFFFIESDTCRLLNNYFGLGVALLVCFLPHFINGFTPIKTLNKTLWQIAKIIGYLSFFALALYCLPFFELLHSFCLYAIVISFAAISLYLLIALGVAAFKNLPKAKSVFIVCFISLGFTFEIMLFPFIEIDSNRSDLIYLMIAGSIFETIAFMIVMAQVTLEKSPDRDWLARLAQSNQENVMRAIVKSQEDERRRFAEDMHDGLGQLISSLHLNLTNLESIQSTQTEKRLEIFQTSRSIIEDMYGELKNICFNLMPQTLISSGIAEALKESANRINKSDKLYVSVKVYGLNKRLSELQEISIYRISQEWINNIIKYANAKRITLQITKDDEEITLMIEDDGIGFDISILHTGKGNGWKNISSRANLMKAAIHLDSTPVTRGSTFILNIPLLSPQSVQSESLKSFYSA